MALYCFWFRRACSHYVVLGQPLPPESRLDAHVRQCSQCREYWNDLRMLTTDLDRLVHVPHASPQFAEPIWERVKPATRTVPWGRLSLAATAALGLACGLVWWRLASPKHEAAPGVQIVKSPAVKMPDEPPAPQVAPDPRPAPVHRAPMLANDTRPHGSHHLKWTPVRNGGTSHSLAVRSRHRSLPAFPLRQVRSAAGLRASGLMYEAQGDPGLANVAYQAAYAQHPSDETAFDVGRSAEESGDMEQAMNVYAGLLESADARTRDQARDQKGWTP